VGTEVRLLQAVRAELTGHAEARADAYRWTDPARLAASLPGRAWRSPVTPGALRGWRIRTRIGQAQKGRRTITGSADRPRALTGRHRAAQVRRAGLRDVPGPSSALPTRVIGYSACVTGSEAAAVSECRVTIFAEPAARLLPAVFRAWQPRPPHGANERDVMRHGCWRSVTRRPRSAATWVCG